MAQLRGLARLGEMIFVPRSRGIFYLSSIKKFVMSLEKDCLIKYFSYGGELARLEAVHMEVGWPG